MNDNQPTSELLPKIKPCIHMRRWLSALSDETLSGFALWYAKLHLSDCSKCRAALEALRALRDRLRSLAGYSAFEQPVALSPNRMNAFEAALDEVDHRHL